MVQFVAIFIACFSFYMMIRNQWVLHTRLSMIENTEAIGNINDYLSYDEMMAKFWVWDIKRLRK